jgi:hypothetical protein
MKNKLIDLNDHLFMQLERLGDESLSKDELRHEIERSKAIASISSQIVSNASLVLDAQKFRTEYAGRVELPSMIEGNKNV